MSGVSPSQVDALLRRYEDRVGHGSMISTSHQYDSDFSRSQTLLNSTTTSGSPYVVEDGNVSSGTASATTPREGSHHHDNSHSSAGPTPAPLYHGSPGARAHIDRIVRDIDELRGEQGQQGHSNPPLPSIPSYVGDTVTRNNQAVIDALQLLQQRNKDLLLEKEEFLRTISDLERRLQDTGRGVEARRNQETAAHSREVTSLREKLTTEISTLRRSLAREEGRRLSASAREDALRVELQNLRDELARKDASVASNSSSHATDLARLERDLAVVGGERDSLREQIDDMRAQLAAYRATASINATDADVVNTELKSQLEAALTKVSSLQGSLERESSLRQTAESRADFSGSKMNLLQKEVEEERRKSEAASAAHTPSRAASDNMEAIMTLIEERIQEVTENMALGGAGGGRSSSRGRGRRGTGNGNGRAVSRGRGRPGTAGGGPGNSRPPFIVGKNPGASHSFHANVQQALRALGSTPDAVGGRDLRGALSAFRGRNGNVGSSKDPQQEGAETAAVEQQHAEEIVTLVIDSLKDEHETLRNQLKSLEAHAEHSGSGGEYDAEVMKTIREKVLRKQEQVRLLRKYRQFVRSNAAAAATQEGGRGGKMTQNHRGGGVVGKNETLRQLHALRSVLQGVQTHYHSTTGPLISGGAPTSNGRPSSSRATGPSCCTRGCGQSRR